MIIIPKRIFYCSHCECQLKYPTREKEKFDVVCYFCWIITNNIDFKIDEDELLHVEKLSFYVTCNYSEKNKEVWK